MLESLASTAREVRRTAGLRQIDIAVAAGVAHTVISDFEHARGWPNRLDEIIGAYAAETGREPADIWASAVGRWRASQP